MCLCEGRAGDSEGTRGWGQQKDRRQGTAGTGDSGTATPRDPRAPQGGCHQSALPRGWPRQESGARSETNRGGCAGPPPHPALSPSSPRRAAPGAAPGKWGLEGRRAPLSASASTPKLLMGPGGGALKGVFCGMLPVPCTAPPGPPPSGKAHPEPQPLGEQHVPSSRS